MRRGKGFFAVLAAFAVLASTILLAACGDDDKTSTTTGEAATGKQIKRNAANAGVTITVGSKNFTEEFILGEIYAQALQAAGYNVKKDLNYGSEQIAFKALKAGKLDGYPEYTSTALTSFFGVKRDRRSGRREAGGGGLAGGVREGRADRLRPNALHERERGGHAEEEG